MRYICCLLCIVLCTNLQAQPSLYGLRCDSVIINMHTLEGYTDKMSYMAGDTLRLLVHSPNGKFNVQVYNVQHPNSIYHTKTNIDGAVQNYTACAFANGCNWQVSYQVVIPSTWHHGYYNARIYDGIKTFNIYFVIKPLQPTSPIAILAATNTWQAYNDWQGVSFYKYDVTPNPLQLKTSDFLSFQRPLAYANVMRQEFFLLDWFSQMSYPFDVITEADLMADTNILSRYKVLIINQHSEYWTEGMYNQLESFLNSGGNLINLSANSVYWKVTTLNNQIECRKGEDKHTHDGTNGGRWRKINRPESSVLGSQYSTPGINTYAPYQVLLPDHWIFEGMSVYENQLIGADGVQKHGASGWETDKVTSFSPQNIEIIARGANTDTVYSGQAGADMTFYWHKVGGGVFSVGSMSFTQSLVVDTLLGKMLSNVIKKFVPFLRLDTVQPIQLSGTFSNGGFYLLNSVEKNCYIQVFDTTGKLLLSKSDKKRLITIDLTNVSSGVYIIHATNGNQTLTQKIIKQ